MEDRIIEVGDSQNAAWYAWAYPYNAGMFRTIGEAVKNLGPEGLGDSEEFVRYREVVVRDRVEDFEVIGRTVVVRNGSGTMVAAHYPLDPAEPGNDDRRLYGSSGNILGFERVPPTRCEKRGLRSFADFDWEARTTTKVRKEGPPVTVEELDTHMRLVCLFGVVRYKKKRDTEAVARSLEAAARIVRGETW